MIFQPIEFRNGELQEQSQPFLPQSLFIWWSRKRRNPESRWHGTWFSCRRAVALLNFRQDSQDQNQLCANSVMVSRKMFNFCLKNVGHLILIIKNYFQLCILSVDFVWGFLFAPILLLPLTAALCSGLLCGSETGRHAGVVSIVRSEECAKVSWRQRESNSRPSDTYAGALPLSYTPRYWHALVLALWS